MILFYYFGGDFSRLCVNTTALCFLRIGCRNTGAAVYFIYMNPVVHFEMPAEDKKRMAEFYTNAFGWKTQMLGPEMGEYVVAHTTETDEKGMVKTPGAINGGFYQKGPDVAMNYPSVVISVENLEASMKKVTDAGGRIVGEPQPIPGVGRFVSIVDTEGNRVSILEPLLM